MAIGKKINNLRLQADCLLNLGCLFKDLRRILEAKENYQKARELYEQMELYQFVQYCDREVQILDETEPSNKITLWLKFILSFVLYNLFK